MISLVQSFQSCDRNVKKRGVRHFPYAQLRKRWCILGLILYQNKEKEQKFKTEGKLEISREHKAMAILH